MSVPKDRGKSGTKEIRAAKILRSGTIRAALVGAAALVIVAVLNHYFGINTPSRNIAADHQSVIVNNSPGAQIVVGERPKPEDISKAKHYVDPSDPSILVLRAFDLLLDEGVVTNFGNCPNAPCLLVKYAGITAEDGQKIMTVSIGGEVKGLSSSNANGIAWSFPPRRGCGFDLQGSDYDLALEVVDETLSTARGLAAINPGSNPGREGGWSAREIGCPSVQPSTDASTKP